MKRHEYVTHNQKKKTEKDPEIAETLELRDKDLETSNINIINFKDVNIMRSKCKIKNRIKWNVQIKCPLSEIKISLSGINIRENTSEEKIS